LGVEAIKPFKELLLGEISTKIKEKQSKSDIEF